VNVAIWVLAGCALGWAGFALLRFNRRRGGLASLILGAAGGLVGGSVLAPLASSSPIVSGDFNIQALFIAVVTATACLVIGNMVEKRFGF